MPRTFVIVKILANLNRNIGSDWCPEPPSDSTWCVDDVNFNAYDNACMFCGTFGIAKHHLAQGKSLKTKTNMPPKKASEALAHVVIGTMRAFCADAAVDHICIFTEDECALHCFDGAPYAQLSCLILCLDHFQNAL